MLKILKSNVELVPSPAAARSGSKRSRTRAAACSGSRRSKTRAAACAAAQQRAAHNGAQRAAGKAGSVRQRR